jgi:hypothetical protein
MRRLLFNSTILFLWTGLVFFSCAGRGKEKAAGDAADTSGKSHSVAGNPVSAQQSDTLKRSGDTTLRYQTEVRHSGPDQARIDSIKNAKTKKKK